MRQHMQIAFLPGQERQGKGRHVQGTHQQIGMAVKATPGYAPQLCPELDE